MTIHKIKEGAKEIYAKALGIKSGDTVILPPSLSDKAVKFIKVPGTKDNPVIITNGDNTPVIFPEAWVYLIDCGYVHFEGKTTAQGERGLQFNFRIADQGKLGGVTFDNISLIMGDDIKRGNQIGISIKQDQEDHFIDYVRVLNSYLEGPKHGGEALYFGKGPNRIGTVEVRDNHFVGWGEGIQSRYADKVIIRDNEIESVYPLPHKVERKKTQGPQAGEVVLAYEPTVAAISIGDGNKNVWIEDNTITNCGGRFLHYTSGNGVIAGNDVIGIGLEHEKYKEAIKILMTNDTVEIRDNTFENVKGHIISVSSSIGENVYFQGNTIIEPDGNKKLYNSGSMPESNLVGNVQLFERHASPPKIDRIALLEQKIDDLALEVGKNAGIRKALAEIKNVIDGALAEPPNPKPDKFVLWSADHSTGDFSQWEYRQGRAIYNSNTEPGTSNIQISDDVAHSGKYSLKLSLTGAENGQKQGARIFRRWLDGNNQMPLPEEAYYSAWYYIPQNYEISRWWNIFQFKSRGASSEPMFSFNVGNLDNGEMYLYVWDKANGKAHRQENPLILPIAKWFHLEAFVQARSTQSGQLVIWQDGIKIIDAVNIRTLRGEGDRLHWSVNNYTDDIVPSDPVIYVDDCAISLERVGS